MYGRPHNNLLEKFAWYNFTETDLAITKVFVGGQFSNKIAKELAKDKITKQAKGKVATPRGHNCIQRLFRENLLVERNISANLSSYLKD